MSRPLRVEFEHAAYHVTSRGNEQKEIFLDDADRLRFLQTLGECCQRFGLVVHAYCLMPNHYHLLVQTPRANLSRAIGWLQTAYCVRFNRRHGRCGHLVQGRFKAHLVQADSYAKQLIRYIHLNPVRPRDRRKPVPPDRRSYFESYRWSSHRAYAGTLRKAEANEWLCTEWLSYWGNRRGEGAKAYARDIASCFGQAVARPLDELRGGLVLGDESLWKKVRKLLSEREGEEELRWTRRDSQAATAQQVRKLIEEEPDRRIKIWARVRLGGEPPTSVARALGFAGPSGVHQTVTRLDAAAKADPQLHRRLDQLKKEVSCNVDSAEKPSFASADRIDCIL